MRIGIDARAATEEPGGKGRYVRELVRALRALDTRHRFLLFGRSVWEGVETDERLEWRIVPGRGLGWHARVARAARGEIDAYVATQSYVSPLLIPVPTVLVVHDLVVFVHPAGAHTRAAAIERLALRAASARAAAIVCDSQTTARDLVRRVPAAAAKSRAVPCGVGDEFSSEPRPDDAAARARHGVNGAYLLAVGTQEPRKNLARLVEAFAGLPEPIRRNRTLVLAGPEGWGTTPLGAALERAQGRVRVIGHVPDADLPALYRGCELFCFPSLYEGFGLPVLEAMACGAPVLASTAPAVVEVGGEAARYVDPLDPGTITAGIADLLQDDAARSELSAHGVKRAAQFTWMDTARGVLEAVGLAAASR